MPTLRRQRPAIGAGPPSRLLLERAGVFSRDSPVLDAGCGTGRNALAVARLGLNVVCADKNRDRLLQLAGFAGRDGLARLVLPICADLGEPRWPFREGGFSAVVCVHFLNVDLFPLIHQSLCAGGFLFLETVGGQGENHRELPRAGRLRALLSPLFNLEGYEERVVGPPRQRKRAVRLFGRKRA